MGAVEVFTQETDLRSGPIAPAVLIDDKDRFHPAMFHQRQVVQRTGPDPFEWTQIGNFRTGPGTRRHDDLTLSRRIAEAAEIVLSVEADEAGAAVVVPISATVSCKQGKMCLSIELRRHTSDFLYIGHIAKTATEVDEGGLVP